MRTSSAARHLGLLSAVLGPLVLALCAVGAKRPQQRQRLYEQHDAVLATRCEVVCWERKSKKNECIKQCLVADFAKPGSCPELENITPFDSACLDACRNDSQCPGIAKCCRHSCGVTCQSAKGLGYISSLPAIPTDITTSERRRGRTLLVRWNTLPDSHVSSSSRVLYVVEERHHAGRYFTESRLGSWTPRHRTPRSSAVLKGVVKPGRWYQFRVAAVNENGTRGWSDHSMKFITSLGPRPPTEPQNMTVGPLHAAPDGTLWGELRWTHPSSDLPIQRYKIFWSRRLHGAIALNSVLMQHQTVSKDQTKFELKNLQANSLYFLQVQALAQFGKEKLKGEKAQLVLNTTNYTNVTDPPNKTEITKKENEKKSANSKIEGLHVEKIYWEKNKLLARVSWKRKKYSTKYTVTWWAGPCQQSNKNTSSHLQMAVTTKATHFDIYNLEFKCRYRISVREVTSEGFKSFHEASVTFNTPSCNDILSTIHKGVKPNCSIFN